MLLARRARNEETLVAVNALLAAREATTPTVARVVLDAAVGMRALAQEPAWHPGTDATLDAEGTAAALGLLSVDFDRAVPRAWRPYYLRMLALAVGDLQRVLPDLTLDGLRVRFASSLPGGEALAIHEPRSRTIVLPIETAAGTIAHELAHDLDWQAARTIYHRRGTYSTDVSVVRRDGRLAASLRGMTAARLIPPSEANGYRPPHQQRPAEVFARNVDWFVAVALARDGRSNGYLSAMQDEALTGYASVLPREVGGPGGAALMDALEEMAFVNESTREWFLDEWGATRTLHPMWVVRQAVTLWPRRGSGGGLATRAAGWASIGIETPVRESLAACADHSRAAAGTVASIAWLAAESRARGIVRARAEWYRPTSRPAWADAVLGEGPWSPELGTQVLRRVRAQILTQLRGGGELAGPFDVGELRAPVCE